MQLILLERIGKLGQIGDIVNVKDGYARNFLLPKKKALRATEANKKYFEQQRKAIEARNAGQIKEAEKVAKAAQGAKVVLLRQAGETGQLYGSVTSRDIAVELRKQKIQVRRGNIILDTPIKEIGIAKVKVSLHADVVMEVDVNVARSAEEAQAQVIAAVKLFESKELAEAAEAALSDEPAEEEAAEEAAKETVVEAAEETTGETSEKATEEGSKEKGEAEDTSEKEDAGDKK
ncbi:MAG: 50S ribosomal protein L9 [Sphingomonadales bacterium]